MSTQRKRHSAEFKAKVALEAFKGMKTVPELARDHQVHPTQINQWRKQLREGAPSLFEGRQPTAGTDEAERAMLYEKIGRLNMELDWLKKKVEATG